MRTALIVVDMQEGSFTPRTIRHDAAGLIGRLNDLAARVRQAGGLVVFVQHNGPPGDPHHPSSPGWKVLHELRRSAQDRAVTKTACDAFLGTDLDDVLHAENVARLIVTGCATDFCVDTTIRSALAKGYPTIAPSDGHTTGDRRGLSAPQVIAHHNAIWAEFLSPAGPAQVVPCSEIVL